MSDERAGGAFAKLAKWVERIEHERRVCQIFLGGGGKRQRPTKSDTRRMNRVPVPPTRYRKTTVQKGRSANRSPSAVLMLDR